MLKTLISVLAEFFTNSVEVNLSLTGALIDLATCGFMKIDGWLLPDPSKYIYDSDDYDETIQDPFLAALGDPIEAQEKAQMRDLKRARRTPKWSDSQTPKLLIQLRKLVEEISTYRSDIPRFDELLQQRREAFQASSSTTAAPMPIHKPTPPRSDISSPSRSASPPRPSAFDSFASRIFPDLGTPSRSHSPRGRRSQERSNGGSSFATPRVPPPQFPMGGEVGSRGSSRAFSPSPLRGAELGSVGLESQAVAFAAVDQSILARKVGRALTKEVVGAIPFPDLKGSDKESNEEVAEGAEELGLGEGENGEDEGEGKKVSVNHVLTNVIVLQEFILELAALVQVRAGLFGEVRYV